MVPLFVIGRRPVLDNTNVSWVKSGYQSLDRSSLARGVPALEHHTDRGAEFPPADQAAIDKSQMEQSALGCYKPWFLLTLRQALGAIQLVESTHARSLHRQRPPV